MHHDVRTSRLRAAFVFLFAAALLPAQVERVAYTVTYQADVLDRAFVTATILGKATAEPIDLQIPTWSPGAYEIKPFYKRILNVVARDARDAAVAVERVDDLTWRLAPTDAWPIRVSYDRLDQPQGLADTSGPELREENYVGFLPTDTFLYVVGKKEVPHEARFIVPQGWLVQMALEKGEQPFTFRAPDYDTLVDAPVELGHLTVHRFEVGGAVYSIVLDRQDRRFPLLSLEALLRRIIRYQVGMFFGKAPYSAYEFHLHDGPGWGLEHLTSTTLAVPRFLVRRSPAIFDSLYAHEFFHLWNVKRLRPKQLGPFDYTKPVRTRSLWFSEGVTDYYADVTCFRTGLWHDGKFLDTIRGEIQTLQGTPRRLTESVEDASWRAFDRGYDDLGAGANINYYNKGKLIGLCLDLLIRDKTRGERSLDDVMRGLYEKYALPKPGFDDGALPEEFSNLAGFDLKPFFASYVRGMEELPFAELLAPLGVAVTPGVPDVDGVRQWWTASELAFRDGVVVVRKPSERLADLGLEAGDVIESVNDAALPKLTQAREALPLLLPARAGAAILKVRREEKSREVVIPFPPLRNWDVARVPNPTPEQRARFNAYALDRYSELVPDGPTLDTVGVPPPKR